MELPKMIIATNRIVFILFHSFWWSFLVVSNSVFSVFLLGGIALYITSWPECVIPPVLPVPPLHLLSYPDLLFFHFSSEKIRPPRQGITSYYKNRYIASYHGNPVGGSRYQKEAKEAEIAPDVTVRSSQEHNHNTYAENLTQVQLSSLIISPVSVSPNEPWVVVSVDHVFVVSCLSGSYSPSFLPLFCSSPACLAVGFCICPSQSGRHCFLQKRNWYQRNLVTCWIHTGRTQMKLSLMHMCVLFPLP